MENLDSARGPRTLKPDFSEQAKVFRAQLFGWREVLPAAHLYVLLDLNHPVPKEHALYPERLACRKVKRNLARVLRPDLSHEPELLPQLLQVYEAGENGYADESLLEQTLQCASERASSVNGAYVAGWLCSEASPTALATHLAQSGQVFDAFRTQRRFLPFFEPYRLALLCGEPSAARFVQRWLGPIEHWMFTNTSGSLQWISKRHAAAESNASQAATLNAECFAAQARVGLARFVVLALERAGISIASGPERQIDAAIAAAQRNGLREAEDIVFFALNNFTLGDRWATHSRVAHLIQRVQAESEVTLASLMSELPDDVLDDIARPAKPS